MRFGKEKVEKIDTIVGPHAHFEGTLFTKESLRIEGEVRGKIECDGSLVIGSGADVEAEILAGNVFVAGTLKGNVTARRRFEITGKGNVQGDVVAAEVVLEEGVAFNGRCRMLSDGDALESAESLDETPKIVSYSSAS